MSDQWFEREYNWCPLVNIEDRTVPAVLPNDGPLGRTLLQPRDQNGSPVQGLLSQQLQDQLYKEHEQLITNTHAKLHSLGSNIATCRLCGVRSPDVTIENGCPTCIANPPLSENGVMCLLYGYTKKGVHLLLLLLLLLTTTTTPPKALTIYKGQKRRLTRQRVYVYVFIFGFFSSLIFIYVHI